MNMILLTEEQANSARGMYGEYSMLDPFRVVEGWALPIKILEKPEFSSVKDFLSSLPQQEVTLIVEDDN